MFAEAYKRAFGVLKSKPIRLWGLSLLVGFISVISILFSLGFLPIGIAFVMVIQCGMTKVYLDGLKGSEVNADQIFEGCKSGKSFFRFAGGMAWKSLWEMIWSLLAIVAIYFGFVPALLSGGLFRAFGGYGYGYGSSLAATLGATIVWLLVAVIGFIPAIYKSYEYRFTPYILITRPDVNATAALRLSKQLTKGKKGQMFLADLILVGGFYVIYFVLSMLGKIPYIGVLFAIIAILVSLAYSLFAPIFTGLYQAAFFEMPVQPRQTPYNNMNPNPNFNQNQNFNQNPNYQQNPNMNQNFNPNFNQNPNYPQNPNQNFNQNV